MHTNQFGYQLDLSSKNAYFVINEGIQYFNSIKKQVELVQLDKDIFPDHK